MAGQIFQDFSIADLEDFIKADAALLVKLLLNEAFRENGGLHSHYHPYIHVVTTAVPEAPASTPSGANENKIQARAVYVSEAMTLQIVVSNMESSMHQAMRGLLRKLQEKLHESLTFVPVTLEQALA